jgi:S-adenosylmethionine/arginine decarboxylase-like enzyme
MQSDTEVLTAYSQNNHWGLLSSIDLTNCDPDLIRDAQKIKEFVIKLCDLIEMKRFGETVVVEFGDDPRVHGFSMTQLIETSLISGHFANETNSVYLDIFSCKEYPPFKAAEFAKEYFKASDSKVNIIFRG